MNNKYFNVRKSTIYRAKKGYVIATSCILAELALIIWSNRSILVIELKNMRHKLNHKQWH